MTEEKSQLLKSKKKFGFLNKVRNWSSPRKSIAESILILALSIPIALVIVYFAISVTKIFPDFISITTETNLLNTLINADGIILGFSGIVFAQLLSAIMDQQNALYQRILEKPNGASRFNKSMDFLDLRKYQLVLMVIIEFASLSLSILSSMVNIAKISKFSSTDTFSNSALFSPLLFLILSVTALAIALVALPTRPPLEKIKSDKP